MLVQSLSHFCYWKSIGLLMDSLLLEELPGECKESQNLDSKKDNEMRPKVNYSLRNLDKTENLDMKKRQLHGMGNHEVNAVGVLVDRVDGGMTEHM